MFGAVWPVFNQKERYRAWQNHRDAQIRAPVCLKRFATRRITVFGLEHGNENLSIQIWRVGQVARSFCRVSE
jgi:hypothetical protein